MINFQPLTLKDQQLIKKFTEQFPPYSDFNFTSLWSYNTNEDFSFFLDNEKLIIQLRNYITNKKIYSILSKKLDINTIIKITDNENNIKQLNLVPEDSLNDEIKANNNLLITEDRDNFDYVISTEATSVLQGSHYDNKRQHIHQFKRLYPDCFIKISKCDNQIEHSHIRSLFDVWAAKKTGDSDTSHEKIALNRLLNSPNLPINLIGIWDKERLIGFTIDEKIDNYVLGHFMKADTSYRYIYDMLLFQSASYWKNMGCHYINYEQDLGIEGLRKTKSSWHPIKFLKKYTITLNEI